MLIVSLCHFHLLSRQLQKVETEKVEMKRREERTGGRGVRERRVIMRKKGVGDVKGGKDRKMWPRDDVREDRENNDAKKRLKIMVEGNKINYKKVLKVCLTLTSYFDMNIFNGLDFYILLDILLLLFLYYLYFFFFIEF